MKKKTAFIALLSVFAISGGLGAVMTSGCSGCSGTIKRIDAPAELEADLGTYVIPDYDVVDNNGMILAGYNVFLKSVKDADGEELAESYGSAVTIEDAGIYSFVYSAGTKKVEDVTVSIDFADRTAPTINCDDSTIPKFFIPGNSYKVPSYTLSGDFVREKCWAKVFYIDGDNAETEVAVESGRFKVDKSSGTYEIRIHVEDAVGNANDYKYARKADGPENIVENKVLYLDEQFGERQVSCYQSEYTGGYVSKDAEGAKVYEDENGAYKVSFDGEKPTRYNEGLVVMDVPAIIDINEFENLYMYVYNDSEKDIIMGSQWWNDTKVEKGKWTRLTWNTRAWGYNTSANNTKQIGLVDISGMTIRFVFDYDQKVIPSGDFYLSAMYATPKVKTELETDENVTLNGTKYFVNDLVELNAVQIDGKTVDYYKVDGEIIPGNNFIVTDTKHKIEVVYKEGELTKDDMTWARPEEFEVEGDDNQWQTMGISDYFAYTFDIYGAGEGWCYAGVQVGGNGQLLGFEISDAANSKFSGYGGAWKWMSGVKLTERQYDAIRGATQDNPVKAVLVRRGTEIRAYLVYGGKTEFIASVTNTELGISENRYGYGQRSGPINISHNVAVVGGETKTLLYFENNFNATLKVDGNEAEGEYYLGDSIALTPEPAPENKMFAYFKVNGTRIGGNKFVLTSPETSVETVYTDIATLTLAEGIKTADGKTGTVHVAKETHVVLDFTGTAPEGKYFVGFTVDGTQYVGNSIYVSADTHEVGVLFAQKEQTGAEKLNDISDGSVVYAKDDEDNDKWKPASVEHVTNFRYDGSDGAVDENSVIKIVTGKDSGENSFAFDNSLVSNLDTYSEIYFYAYTKASGIKAGGWWCGDTVLVPEKWTKVTFGRNLDPGTIEGNGETKVWKDGMNKFAFRIFGAPEGETVYVTAVYGLPYPNAEVTVAEDSTDKLTVSEPENGEHYRVMETVTLAVKGDVPAGKLFAYFTANGEKIEGNKYVLTGDVEFGVVYNDISRLNIGTGIRTADGRDVYARDVKVTLVFEGTSENGKVFDYFTVDGVRIIGDTFVTKNAEHTVAAVLANGAENLTWVTDTEAEKSSVTYSWSDGAYTFNGNAVGQSTHWAVKTVITELVNFDDEHDQWYGFDFLVGTNASIQIRIHTTGRFTVQAMGKEHADGADIGVYLIDAAKVVKACKEVSAQKPVSFTVVREGDTYYVLFNGELAVRSNFDFKAADNKFGVGGTNCGWLPLYQFASYKYRTGGDVTEYLTFARVTATSQVSIDKTEEIIKLGETVTLTVKGEAPAGQKFVYFTANGKPIVGDKYVVRGDVEFGAVFNDYVEIALGSGVKVEGVEADADGKITVGKGATLTLSYTGEIPSGKYFNGFKVNGERIQGNTVTVEGTEQTIEAAIENKIQTGADKLNDITDDVLYAKDDGGNNKWAPASVEHVTDFRFSGMDGAVDENSVIKIVTGGDLEGENSFAFDSSLVKNLDIYKEIYFYVYTQASGIKAGGWWCGDTAIVPGKWTKVAFDGSLGTRSQPGTIDGNGEIKVWDAGIEKFAFRIFNAPEGVTVYVTAVYGLPYPDAQVTIAESSKQNMEVSSPANGKQHKVNETVTLTAADKEGLAFAYFTANGEPIEGTTYRLTGNVEFGVVYSEYSTLNLANGIATSDGKTGEIRVARNKPVYLKLTDDTKYYLDFSVDGEVISGNSFTPTEGKTYSVTVRTADRTSSSGVQLNSVSGAAMHNNGNAELQFTNNIAYNGADGAVKEGGSLKVVAGDGDVAVKSTKTVGEAELKNFKEVYFYIYTLDDGVKAGTWWCNDTAAAKGQWTKVTVYKDANLNKNGNDPYDAEGVSGKLFAEGSKGSNFIFRIMGGEGKTVYVTSLYGVPYADATVKIAEDSKDSLTVSDPANGTQYKEGETVTLTVKGEAPAGTAFAYFTADGKSIKGNKYVLEAGEVTFGVVFSEISVITLGEGVTAEGAADGKVTVGRGATVTLVFNGTVPSGKYFKGFTVDGVPISADTFAAEGEAHTVAAVFEDKIQTGSDKLNEISTVADDKLSYHPTETGWRPEKIEYVTDVKYRGSDGAIDENGSLKVTLKGGEQAFALNKTLINKLDVYKEIYFFIYADKNADVSGIKIGGWWCRDVDVVAGQWTRVSFTREKAPQNVSQKSVWAENSIDKFVFSFESAKAGTVVYLTAIYGVLYDEVSVTVDDSVKDYVSFTGVCREGQTITLSHSGAPEGQAFAYFTVNNEKLEGSTYVLGKQSVVIGAVFSDISVITLGSGVTVEGAADGKITVGRGASVTLVIDSATAPADKVFDCFKVDGVSLSGNTFKATAAAHSVTAVFIDKAVDITWNVADYAAPDGTIDSWGAYKKLGSADNWVLSYDVTATNADSTVNPDIPNQWYSGVLFRNNQIVGYEMGEHTIKNYLGSAGSGTGSTWEKMQSELGELVGMLNGSSSANPVTLTFVRQGNKLSAYIISGDKTYLVVKDKTHAAFDTQYGLDFGYGWRTDCGGTPDIDNIKYVTGEGKTGLFVDSLKANISFTKASADQSVYHLGDTVTLIADAAETGKKFLRFTVNGEPLTGNTFTVNSTESYEVVAEYSDISTLTLGDGVKTADGNTEYARGAKVTLIYDGTKLDGEVVDHYVIDEGATDEQRVFNGEFTTTKATHTVKAVLKTVETMTWTNVGFGTPTGGDAQGYKVDSGKYWAFEYDFCGVSSGNIYTGMYIGGNVDGGVQVLGFQIDGSEQKLGGYGGKWQQMNVCNLSESQVGILRNASEDAPVKITFIRENDIIKVYLSGQLAGSCTFSGFNISGDDFGFGTRNNYGIGTLKNIRTVTDKNKVGLYSQYMNANAFNGQTSETQINSIYNAKILSGSGTLEYVDMPEGLEDRNVKENGVMKVSVTDNEFALNVNSVFTSSLDAYKEIYFWVYVSDEDTTDMQAGTYWCANTNLSTGWNKITVKRDTNWAYIDGKVVYTGVPTGVGEQKVYEVGAQVFVYRLMKCSGKTLYITSLYGVPKDVEPVVQNGATNYSLVSGDDELTAIVNDNFFPDAE